MSEDDLTEVLDVLLPQTQCRQCGHAGCRPYAAAMAAGQARANQCPPGGAEVARALAAALGADYAPVDPRFGLTKPPAVALIDEAACIGCTLCIQACPVDAIVGAAQHMHTVISDACTGCELCLPPCPVDCIAMIATGVELSAAQQRVAAREARRRYEARLRRLERGRAATAAVNAKKADSTRKNRTVERAVARARARLAQSRGPR
jgi:electron transport complex protein RnfB